MACLTPENDSGRCFVWRTCAKQNGSGSDFTFSQLSTGGVHICYYADSSSIVSGNMAVVPASVAGSGMTTDQLDLLMFGFLMVIFVIGIVMGHKLTAMRNRYGGDT